MKPESTNLETERVFTVESPQDKKLFQQFSKNREAYQLYGDNPLSDGDIKRYIRSNNELQHTDFSLIIKKGLRDEHHETRQIAAELIQYAKEEDRREFIKTGLKDDDIYVLKRSAEMIEHAREEDKEELREILNGVIKRKLVNSPRSVIEMIKHTKENYRGQLIKDALMDRNISIRTVAAGIIKYAREEERSDLIKKGLMDNVAYVNQRAAQMIEYAKEEDKEELREILASVIKRGLANDNMYVQERFAEMIEHLREESKVELQKILASVIKKGLKNEDVYVRLAAADAGMIEHVREEDKEELQKSSANIIRQALDDGDIHVRQTAALMIEFLPEEMANKLETTNKDLSELERLATSTVLYQNAPNQFFREQFEKTGSSTTLLQTVPGDKEMTLKDKVIIRHIDILAYFNWKTAYESVDLWKKNGFDYVPVEPIVGTIPNKNTLKVSVFTRVLNGPSVGEWLAEKGTFQKNIRDQVERIKKTLEELRIEHGHTHDSNFVVMFPKREDGHVDISKPPRVYVIDFDMARSGGY